MSSLKREEAMRGSKFSPQVSKYSQLVLHLSNHHQIMLGSCRAAVLRGVGIGLALVKVSPSGVRLVSQHQSVVNRTN